MIAKGWPLCRSLITRRVLTSAASILNTIIWNSFYLALASGEKFSPTLLNRHWTTVTGMRTACWESELTEAEVMYDQPGKWDLSQPCVDILQGIAIKLLHYLTDFLLQWLTRYFSILKGEFLIPERIRSKPNGMDVGIWRLIKLAVPVSYKFYTPLSDILLQANLYLAFSRLSAMNAHRNLQY